MNTSRYFIQLRIMYHFAIKIDWYNVNIINCWTLGEAMTSIAIGRVLLWMVIMLNAVQRVPVS